MKKKKVMKERKIQGQKNILLMSMISISHQKTILNPINLLPIKIFKQFRLNLQNQKKIIFLLLQSDRKT